MEAAADVIAHAAERHRAQRVGDHEQRRLRREPARLAPRVLAQQEQQLGRPRKLRRVAEAAAPAIERHLELLDADVERVGAGHGRLGARLARRCR